MSLIGLYNTSLYIPSLSYFSITWLNAMYIYSTGISKNESDWQTCFQYVITIETRKVVTKFHHLLFYLTILSQSSRWSMLEFKPIDQRVEKCTTLHEFVSRWWVDESSFHYFLLYPTNCRSCILKCDLTSYFPLFI